MLEKVGYGRVSRSRPKSYTEDVNISVVERKRLFEKGRQKYKGR